MNNNLVELLMRRDHLTREEAIEMLFTCKEDLERAVSDGNYGDVDDIIMDDLGLEPDYLFDILDI